VLKSSLSTPLKLLLETMQQTNYGRIENLSIQNGEPVFDPLPRIVKDIKLGTSDNGPRPELEASDFLLKKEHIDLFENLRRLKNATIQSIEVKAGLPFRIIVEQRILEYPYKLR
jgi:hypothetical protein